MTSTMTRRMEWSSRLNRGLYPGARQEGAELAADPFAPNVGSHSVFRLMNVGTADESRRASDIPLFTIRNKAT